jgi:hypothetical protein
MNKQEINNYFIDIGLNWRQCMLLEPERISYVRFSFYISATSTIRVSVIRRGQPRRDGPSTNRDVTSPFFCLDNSISYEITPPNTEGTSVKDDISKREK